MKTKDKEPVRKCEKCEEFEISPGGCVETCHAVRTDPTMDLYYAEERMNTNQSYCKAFRKIGRA